MVHFHVTRIASLGDFIETIQAEFATEFNELEAQTGETPPRPTRKLHRIEPAPVFNKAADRRKIKK